MKTEETHTGKTIIRINKAIVGDTVSAAMITAHHTRTDDGFHQGFRYSVNNEDTISHIYCARDN